ncbi:transmembrane protein 265 [Lates japonicus]
MSGETCNQVISSGRGVASCCDDKHHRKLAICSIICGISCIGIKALINSVKAEQTEDPDTAAKFSQRARKLGIISVVTWVGILISIPILLALVSYLLTLQD